MPSGGARPRIPDAGRCAAVFADWQSCSDGGDELIDPSRSQYKEVFLVVNALLDGEEVTTCPYIWVDRDFALTRGWLQGFPKKLGSIWITRTFGLDSAGRPRAAAGRDLRRHVRRLRAARRRGDGDARAGLGVRPDAQRPAARERPPFPRLEAGRHDEPAVHELVRVAEPRPRRSPRSGRAARRSSSSARGHEEHDLLAPVRIGKGFRFTFGYTVDDQEIVKDLRV